MSTIGERLWEILSVKLTCQTAKDIYEYHLDSFVLENDLKTLLDRLTCGFSTSVKEVGCASSSVCQGIKSAGWKLVLLRLAI